MFTEHDARINVMKFNSTGNLLVSGGDDNLIVVWDLVSQRPLFKLTGHTQPITDLHILNLRGVDYVLSGSKDGLVRVWDTRIQECVQIFRTNRNQVLCMSQIFENKKELSESGVREYSFVIGSDSEELLFVNISDYGKDPTTKLPVFVKERGRFVREFFAKVDQIEVDIENGLLLLLADRKQLEVLKFKKQAEVVKKFKRRQKRAKENEKELQTSKDEFLSDLKNWVEPVAKLKLTQKTDQIMLMDKKLVRKILDFDDTDAEAENSESLSGAVFFFYADNSYGLHQYKLDEKDCSFKEAKNFGKVSHQNVIRSVALSSDDAMTLSCSVDSVKLWSNDN